MTIAAEKHVFANLGEVTAHAVEIRHDLHRHPEIGYQEVYTSGVVCKELQRLGIEFKTGFGGGTGVVAMIHGAPTAGPCVALRADMDALPITEETGASYASTVPGKMHACGHDGHTSVLLGAAAILKENAHRLKGSVKLIFQPAEEGLLGAEVMVKEGILTNPKVEAIFGLHGWPGLKVGMVATRHGPLAASVDGFSISIKGRGGHAAAPHETMDPVVCAAAMIQALQTIVSREADPTDASVVTVSMMSAGSAFNVIPETAELRGTLRALANERRRAAIASLERICKGVAAAYRCEVGFTYYGATPPTLNTPAMADFVRDTAVATVGERAFVWAPRAGMWGEDFSFYLEQIPGCFFLLGVQPHDRDSYPMLHNPKYDFTDAAVPVGIRMMTEIAIRYLERGK
jgi:amidohydrolase